MFRSRRRQPDRRASRRYHVKDVPAEFGWYEGDRFATSPATVLDLSLGGALVLAERLPPDSAVPWFRLGVEPDLEWCQVTLLASKSSLLGPSRVRLRFHSHCPYHVFKRAIVGADLPGVEFQDPQFDPRVWR